MLTGFVENVIRLCRRPNLLTTTVDNCIVLIVDYMHCDESVAESVR
jgi:hypothetical protein